MVSRGVNTDDTKTAPLPDGPDMADRVSEYLFIEGMAVVGTVVADCAVCAWRDGHSRWPNALMAIWCGDANATEQCSVKRNREARRRGGVGRGTGWLSPASLTERLFEIRGKMN